LRFSRQPLGGWLAGCNEPTIDAVSIALPNSQHREYAIRSMRAVLADREPEPSGREGLADVRVIRALLESARVGSPVKLEAFERPRRPTLAMEKKRPPVPSPRLVHAEAPSGH